MTGLQMAATIITTACGTTLIIMLIIERIKKDASRTKERENSNSITLRQWDYAEKGWVAYAREKERLLAKSESRCEKLVAENTQLYLEINRKNVLLSKVKPDGSLI